jgi:hypothetical protein
VKRVANVAGICLYQQQIPKIHGVPSDSQRWIPFFLIFSLNHFSFPGHLSSKSARPGCPPKMGYTTPQPAGPTESGLEPHQGNHRARFLKCSASTTWTAEGISVTSANRSASFRVVSPVTGKSTNSRAARRNKDPIKAHSRAVNSRLISFSGGISSSTGV